MSPEPKTAATPTNRPAKDESRREQSPFNGELVEAIANPVYLKDTGGKFICVNRAWEQFYGIRRENCIGKSVHEIHSQFGEHGAASGSAGRAKFMLVILQIGILDIVFSLDSVITAVGMVQEIWIMATAIILAIVVMLIFSETISRFVAAHPTIKMLALSFLILIGVVLVADAVGAHLDKGYIYFAMAFAIGVEMLNIAFRKKAASLPSRAN